MLRGDFVRPLLLKVNEKIAVNRRFIARATINVDQQQRISTTEVNQMIKTFNQLMGAAILALLTVGTAFAQARNQADVQIQSITATQSFSLFPALGQRLNCDVTVFSFNDDTAHNVTLNVILPVEVTVLSVPTGCAAIPTVSGSWHSSVQCNLGTLNVGDSKTIRIATTLPRLSVVAKTFGAFSWSATPDPKPGNNYGEVTVTP
jgi:Domain of unknown function DUF11